jgi:hypothetical protein
MPLLSCVAWTFGDFSGFGCAGFLALTLGAGLSLLASFADASREVDSLPGETTAFG